MDIFLMLRSLYLQGSSGSDYRRWRKGSNLSASWNSRTELMGKLVPSSSKIIEFGAGRQLLRHYISPSCMYTASDLVMRTPETIVCDLNKRPLPDLRQQHFDVAVMGGVLEYIHDLPSVLNWLAQQVRICVASYSVHNPRESAIDEFFQKLNRRNNGWVNTFTQDGIVQAFATAGFRCVRKEIWQDSAPIFVFELV